MNTINNLVRKNKYKQITHKAEYYCFKQMNNGIISEFWNINYQ